MTLESVNRVLEAGEEHTRLLLKMMATTDDLLAAIGVPDVERINRILETRGSLCEQIGHSSSQLGEMIRHLDERSHAHDADVEIAWQGLRLEMDRLQNIRGSLLSKQTECERLLSAKLRECGSDLMAIHHHGNLRTRYQDTPSEQEPRFLDSRF